MIQMHLTEWPATISLISTFIGNFVYLHLFHHKILLIPVPQPQGQTSCKAPEGRSHRPAMPKPQTTCGLHCRFPLNPEFLLLTSKNGIKIRIMTASFSRGVLLLCKVVNSLILSARCTTLAGTKRYKTPFADRCVESTAYESMNYNFFIFFKDAGCSK